MSKLFDSVSESRGTLPRGRLWQLLAGLWSGCLLVTLTAPWAYGLMAALFVTFVHFAVLDERRELDRSA